MYLIENMGLLNKENGVCDMNATSDNDNVTTSLDDPYRYLSPFSQLLVTCVYLFGFGANACALALLSRASSTSRNRNLVLMFRLLAANDTMALCSSFLLVYMRLYADPAFLASRWFCSIRVLARLFGFISGSVLLLMAADGCLSFTTPFFYQKHVTRNLIPFEILVEWCLHMLVVMLVVLLALVGFGLYYEVEPDSEHHVCTWYRQTTIRRDVFYANAMSGVSKGLCLIIVASNLAVVVALCRLSPQEVKRTTTLGRRTSNSTQEEISFASLKVALLFFFIACFFLPHMVTIPLSLASPSLEGHPIFRMADALTALQFILDPIVYVLSRRPHRRDLRRIFKSLCQRCRTVQRTDSSSKTNPSDSLKTRQQMGLELSSR